MEELVEKVDNLINKIDSLELIDDIKELSNSISLDKELLDLIEKYNKTYDNDLKKKIVSNELFHKYKCRERDLNLLIMGINQELKKISNKGKCVK